MTQLDPVQIDSLPASIEEFAALRDQVATTPQGGAAMMVLALHLYAQADDLGQQCLAAAVHPERLDEGAGGYQGLQLRRSKIGLIKSQLGGQPHIPRSYFQGTTPENGYQLPDPPLTLKFSDNPYSEDAGAGTFKVFVACSGADSDRPITVSKDGQGLWRAIEWSTLIVGVKEPAG